MWYLSAVVVQPALGYHITNSQSRYITPPRLTSAQYSLHYNAPSSCKLLKMDVLTSETCWAVNWHNKASVIKLVYLYSNIKMMHGPIRIRRMVHLWCLISWCDICNNIPSAPSWHHNNDSYLLAAPHQTVFFLGFAQQFYEHKTIYEVPCELLTVLKYCL